MALATAPSTSLAWLVPVAGPPMGAVELQSNPRGLLVGRLEHCNIRLALDSVSRNHARIRFDGVRWRITDLKSRWGTFVNGTKIEPQQDVPLAEGDLLRIIPWTFRFSAIPSAKAGLLEGALEAVDDSAEGSKTVQALTVDRLPSLNDDMLKLLLESASGIHAALDEKSLAEIVLDKACLGSGLPNAAVLKPAGTAGRLEVLASRPPGGGSIAYSRSLLNAASDGQVAELSTDRQAFDTSQSIVSLGVRSALCVPLMLGQTVAAYLYLDSRGDPNSGHRLPLRPNASSFCLALGKMASLALANLKRIDMERRTARMEADLSAASAARWILPPRHAEFGPFSYTGESRPGEGLGGDFYDIIPLSNNRLAVAIGDVSGHGIVASVLMTACAGFLHAMLQETGDAALSVNRLNQFVDPRRPVGKFVTLWVGVLDLPNRTLQYVDAGHGYALIADRTGALQQLSGGQIPIGVDDTFRYTSITLPLAPAGQLLMVSDGIVEQFDPPGESPEVAQFGVEGIEAVTRSVGDNDLVAALFDATVKHAGRPKLTDDATAVLVKWGKGK